MALNGVMNKRVEKLYNHTNKQRRLEKQHNHK